MRQVCQDHVCLKLLLVGSLAENVTLNMSWAQPEKGLGAYWMNFSTHPIFSYVELRITEAQDHRAGKKYRLSQSEMAYS